VDLEAVGVQVCQHRLEMPAEPPDSHLPKQHKRHQISSLPLDETGVT
jgi:hypothetical protein